MTAEPYDGAPDAPAARYDLDAERIVLGAVMLAPRVIDDCPITPGDFYHPAHGDLWELIVRQHAAGRPTDMAAVHQQLTTHPIPGVNGAYLHDCVSAVPTVANAGYYAKVINALASLRRLEEAGVRLVQMARTAAWDNADTALESARAEVDQAADARATDGTIRTFHAALTDAMESWEARAAGDVHPTGWADLDTILNGGWRPGHLTVLGARPAVGKSLIAGCAAVQAARAGNGVGFFGLEMSEPEIVARMTAAAANVNLDHIENRQLNDIDWQRITRLHGASYEWRLYLDTRSRLTMAQVRSQVRTWSRRGPLPLVVVDYLQLVAPADTRELRERQVSRITEDCKHLAREFNTHVLALAQVNRGSTHRDDKRPTMSDLRESGGQEAHADEVILLHRDDENSPGEIELIVDKNRHGRTGKVVLAWAPHVSQARDMYRGA